ncbi:MAG: cation:proton antiporter, partial [Bdellovibrionaceae bacterium]|nr:cation:proton antiporter [Pseudobdellovibrionaceae bacterium]
MTHLPALIQDLGVILITAALVTLLFKRLKQPVVLGYLIAGFFVGPHVPILPGVSDTASIQVWAEMGVIFLLFGLGLEFSFKKLAQVGRSASIIATFEVVFMMAIGYFTGQLLGWSLMDGLFLGGILAISSTTIIVRAFDELGLKGKQFVTLVFGALIVEDLAAILLMVILSTLAATQSLAGMELLTTSAKLGFFMILWFVLGIYLLPAFMARVRHLLTDETALVISIGLCLLMVIIATAAGFSPALGAFVMGSLLAETREGHRIEKVLMPVRDLFAAVFFVSVGMLLDPRVLIEHSGMIVLVTALTIVGKFISTALGAIISGERLKNAVKTGMSLSQIGEFSFIIATLGVSLKVTSDFLYPIAVAVSAITTFTTPYMIKSSGGFYEWLEKRIPQTILNRFSEYEAPVKRRGGETGPFGLLWKAYGMTIILNTVVVIALSLAIRLYLANNLREQFGHFRMIDELLGLGALLLSLPFLWAIVFGSP